MKLDTETLACLSKAAHEARSHSYSPYSGFSVGAALLCKEGGIYVGCNMENASYGATSCAERGAFHAAIAAGERDFIAILIVGGKKDEAVPCYPCGICRQLMAEHCGDNFLVLTEHGGAIEGTPLSALLPNAFHKAVLH